MQEDKQSKMRPLERAVRKKNLGVLALLSLPFLVALFLIFRDADNRPSESSGNLLLSIPEGREQRIERDKQKAMERLQAEEEQQKRIRTLAESSFSLKADSSRCLQQEEPLSESFAQSHTSYQALQNEIGSFYTPSSSAPAANTSEIERLQEQVAMLEKELAQKNERDPLEYMERSYALASKYLGGSTATADNSIAAVEPEQKRAVVRRTKDNTVSGLAVLSPDTISVREGARSRNYTFNTAVGEGVADNRNAIRACIDADQTVRSGETVRLRLLEAMQVERYVFPANTVIWGVVGINGQRLSITVSNIECGGSIIPVQLYAHDLDGQPGLNIPGSQARDALKNSAASIGSSLGQSITLARDAGQQVAMDVTRGVLSGGTQYLSDKLREVKIHLKAGYRLLLISQE